jgi:outer membrane protein assembly factor BamE (lipoprotein component of BamABCDE complex)
MMSVRWVAVAAALLLGACDPLVDYRGNLPDPQAVDKLQPGIATKADVTSSLGSPSTVGTFDPNVWYYISRHTETLAFFDPDVIDQRVLEIKFDGTGKVEAINRYGLDDAGSVKVTEAVTPTAGQSMTLFQQLFGNLGRYVGNSSATGGR